MLKRIWNVLYCTVFHRILFKNLSNESNIICLASCLFMSFWITYLINGLSKKFSITSALSFFHLFTCYKVKCSLSWRPFPGLFIIFYLGYLTHLSRNLTYSDRKPIKIQNLPMLPGYQFSIHPITWVMLTTMEMWFTLAWLNIELTDLLSTGRWPSR